MNQKFCSKDCETDSNIKTHSEILMEQLHSTISSCIDNNKHKQLFHYAH